MPLLWLTQLTTNVVNHIENVHHQTWHFTEMVRGVYFYTPQAREAFPIGRNRAAFHFFITNYDPSIHIFHCAAKLENDPPPAIPEAVANLFHGINAQEGLAGDGLEIAWAEIVHPSDFNVTDPNQNLSEELWVDIQARFLLRTSLTNFIKQCAA
jgi:hypothetical protein